MRKLNFRDLDFAVRCLPKSLRLMLEREEGKLFVAGGYLRSVIAREPVSDIDMFTSDKDDAARLACNLGLSWGATPYETDNAYTASNGDLAVQFIHRWSFDTPQECVESFDFTIASAALWAEKKGGATVWCSCCDETYYEDLAAKRLTYRSPVRNEDAGGSILRVLKFYQRGYRITLPSLAAVIARCVNGVDFAKVAAQNDNFEQGVAKVVLGLLKEVDPNAGAEYDPYEKEPQ